MNEWFCMYFVTLLLEFNRPSQKLPEANKRLMVYIGPEAFTMGGRDEDSPRNEQPAYSITLSGTYTGRRRLLIRNTVNLCDRITCFGPLRLRPSGCL